MRNVARPATVRLRPNPRQRNGKNLCRSHPKNRVELRPSHGRGSRAIQAPEALHGLAQPVRAGGGAARNVSTVGAALVTAASSCSGAWRPSRQSREGRILRALYGLALARPIFGSAKRPACHPEAALFAAEGSLSLLSPHVNFDDLPMPGWRNGRR